MPSQRLAKLLIAACCIALLVPGITRPFDSNETNAGWFFGAIVGNFARHGFFDLHGVPLLYTLLDEPATFGFPYLTHPPGLSWLFYAFGPAEWQMRTCSLVFAVLGAWSLHGLVQRRFDARTANVAGFAYVLFPATTVFGQVSYEVVLNGCGLAMLNLLDARVRPSDGARRRAIGGWVCIALIAFVGTWIDWNFVAYCAAAAILCWSRDDVAHGVRTIAAAALGAALGAASILWWKASLGGASGIPSVESALSIEDTVDQVIEQRPELGLYIDSLWSHSVDCYTTPIVVLGGIGIVAALYRVPRVTLALLVAGAIVPLLFAGHIVNKHRMFLVYAAPLFALATGVLGALALRIAPRPLAWLGLAALLATPLWQSIALRQRGFTDFHRDVGRVLSAATTEPGAEQATRKRFEVAHNLAIYGCYAQNEHVLFPPFFDPNWVVGGLAGLPPERGVRYLFVDATYDPPVPAAIRPDLAAYLAQFPRERVPQLEVRYYYDPPTHATATVHEAWLYTVRDATAVK